MSKSRRTNRPFTRQRRAAANQATDRVLARGGRAPSSTRATVDALEPRKLLFSLTVTADTVDPATGLGTVTAQFGYVIPFLFRQIPMPMADTVVDENFDDEMAPWTMQIPPTPPSGTFFDESQIRITYNSVGTNPAELVQGPGGMQDRNLRVTLTTNDSMTFGFFSGVATNMPMPRLANLARVTVQGLDTGPTGTRVELLRAGQVVRTLSGAALAAVGVPVVGGTRFTLTAPNSGFDSFRFSSAQPSPDNNNYFDTFTIVDINAAFPSGRFGTFNEDRVFGAQVTLTGPVGASAQVLDLYGREMVQTIALGVPTGGGGDSQVALVDLNDDGVPDFNDGIGRINLTGTDTRTMLTMYGAKIMLNAMPPFQLVDTPIGFFDDFEMAGFGFGISRMQPPTVLGLPPGTGSVIVGSPFVRNNTSPAAYLAGTPFPTGDDFVRADQGIFATSNNESVGSVLMHGILFGSSQFAGALGRLSTGLLMGSATVQGDLGALTVAGDAGLWVRDDQMAGPMQPTPVNDTNSELFVGRTVGSIDIGGRSTMSINVLGDINNTARPQLNFLDYAEREVVYGIDPATMDGIRLTHQVILASNTLGSQAIPFGSGLFRNDTIASAEFIGYNAAAVRVSGQVGLQDPINTGEDPSDVYAFVADGTTDVVIQNAFGRLLQLPRDGGGFPPTIYVRVLDSNGRIVAGPNGPNRAGANAGTGSIRFRPDHADVYYLDVAVAPDTAFATGIAYTLTLSGMAPTTFGSYRSGAMTGNGGGGVRPANIILSTGSMGTLRIGTGYVDRGGAENDTTEILNNNLVIDNLLRFTTASVSVPGNLYSIFTGSDINGARIVVGGNLGTLVTGLAPVAGIGVNQGDVFTMDLTVGGQIGLIDIKGGLAIDQAPDPDARNGLVIIRTGTGGGPGNIGQILVGAYASGSNVTITTSPGSVIDGFIIGANNGGAGSEFPGQIRDAQPVIQMGVGSDLRFMDFTQAQTPIDPNSFRPLAFGQAVIFTDDAGASVSIRIVGGAGAAATSFARVRLQPIDGSQGVAIARIDVTLNGGANLEITGVTAGLVSIGRINVTTDGAGGSSILIGGALTEIDVWQINHIAGTTLANITNLTSRGDIVAIDALALNSVRIGTGDLGRTQTHGIGPRLLGPYLDVASGHNGMVGGPLGVTVNAINIVGLPVDWNGAVHVAVNPPAATYMTPVPLEFLGSPIDGYLNGLVVRTGDITSVIVGGSIGDVINQGGHIISVTANADGITPNGEFNGIIGNIYATAIGTVDVGDGLADPGPSPFAAAGIFADDDIVQVLATRGLGATIRGAIVAANNASAAPRFTIGTTPGNIVLIVFPVNGVGLVDVRQGRYDGAFIYAGALDDFWKAINVRDLDFASGDIRAINGVNTDFFRSFAGGANIPSVTLAGGAYDASVIIATGSIGNVFAGEFRNTTLNGQPQEFRRNEINATGNLAAVLTYNLAGDIKDLTINITGSLTGGLSGRNLDRVSVNVANTVQEVFAANDVRASSITAGRLVRIFGTHDLRSVSIDVAGPIQQVIAGDNITSGHIFSTGPDGRIDLIQARLFLTGDVSSSGPIGTITSTEGDIIGSIVTTDADGSLALLNAGHDILVTTNVVGDVTQVSAGRNIGSLGDAAGSRVINVQGNLTNVSALGGQIYTDIRVGQAITGVIRNARVAALPGNDQVAHASIISFGRINFLDLNGDFNGNIISYSGGIGTVRITSGSFRPGNRIEAQDGSIDNVTITGGHLMGDIIAEEAITAVNILAGADGFWGDIGVNPNLSQFIGFDALRNQLPPGAAPVPTFQGPRIQAGTNIGLVNVEKASMWESSIVAGHSVGRVFVYGVILNDYITPGLGGSFITAGDSIVNIEVNQFVGGAIIAAGVTSLGADNRPGGVGADADTVQFGRIGNLLFHGGIGAVTISAGMNAGADGVYNTADDSVANGISSIGSVTVIGAALVSSAFADNGIGFTSPSIVRGGPGLHQAEPNKVIEFVPATGQVPAGGLNFTTANGEAGHITFTGPGQAYWLPGTGQLVLINTNLATSLIVDVPGNALTNFHVISNDGSSLGFGSIRANMNGDSSFYFDGYVQYVEFGALNTTGSIGAGNDIGAIVVGPVSRGVIDANYINSTIVGGDLGVQNQADISRSAIRLLAGNSVYIAGNDFGLLSVKRDLASLRVIGAVDRAGIRAGRSINSLAAGSLSHSRVSARNDISVINISGTVFDSTIYAGTDLGSDAAFGGAGNAADVTTNGNINSVFIGGSFIQSDIAAGIARGPDGFLGTADDRTDEGHSSIGTVVVAGAASGSPLNSQSYRIASNGTLGPVLVSGQNFVANGNLAVSRVKATPNALRVTDLSVTEDSRVYTAHIAFNQPVDRSTISPALNVFEVRSGGAVTIRLSEGIDYTVTYDPATSTANVVFSRDVTERNLPLQNGVPGPGVYQFTLDAATLRGQTQDAALDGNGDGVPTGPDDDYSGDNFVGDAGDKLVNNIVVVGGHEIDFYAADDLNLVLHTPSTPSGLPATNTPFTVRGTMGDHPDQDINVFRSSGDVDLYRVNLRAGQILRLSAMQGVAQLADRELLDSTGMVLTGTNAQAQQLLADPGDITDLTTEQQFLIKQTGTYFIGIASTFMLVNVADPNNVANIPTIPGVTGTYNFTVDVFDDGDTGFAGDTDSGNGVPVGTAPVPQAFAGVDGVIGTSDDLSVVTIGLYNYTLSPGGDGRTGTGDDFVSGSNGSGITSQRTSGPDGVFGNPDDALVSFVAAAIGEGGQSGVPNRITSDIDVYHLNNGDFIAPGTHIRATLQLTELGSNIGLSPNPILSNLTGDTQFAIFETTNSTGVSDARLVAAPTDILPVGGIANHTIASDGVTSYGYDANGDFFIDFAVPAAQGGAPTQAGKFAIYLQGVVRSDYTLQIVTQGNAAPVRAVQNVLLETNGGTINWLEAGQGVTTPVSPYRTSVNGFSGLIGAQTVDSYVLNNLLAALTDIFNAANVDVRFSSDPSAFENQEFSTVFLTSSTEPTAFFNNGTFGASEHADAFNADHNDDAVVFLPALNVLGNSPSRAGVDSYVHSLTAAVARRVGELVGLRSLDPNNAPANDVMAADSVINPPAGVYRFSNQNVNLSANFDNLPDTNFFIGQQNSVDLLDRILANRF